MRILSGAYKGRKLLSPPGRSGTRPITGLAKKSLFGMLGERLLEATVLDLYCGTGTMGLEALSRGARVCCFADRDRAVLRRLRRNIEDLGVADRSVVWQGDVFRRLASWLPQLHGGIDVAYVDPPYAQTRRWNWQAAAERIFVPLAGRLDADGVVVLRTEAKVELPQRIGPLAIRRTRRYGEMVLSLLGMAEKDGE